MDAEPAKSHPSKFWAYVAVVVGGLLLLTGVASAIGYLGLPFLAFWEDILAPQLGQMAGMFLGLVCGALAIYHGLGSIRNRVSRPLKLPPVYLFWLAFAVVLGLGNVLLNFQVAEEFLFPPVFLLGAALPTVAVLSWAGRRLNWPATWRQGALSLVSGSTLSILVTILLGSVLPLLAYLLIGPLEYAVLTSWGAPGFLLSPEILFFIVFIALQAPIPEEFAKALGPGLMIRRWTSERQAFFVGLASGAGFAILENMLYEGLYAQWSGWTWGGITLLRAIGSVLHPLGTGIIALALFRTRERLMGWFGQLARAYLLSVGLHTLWNGGFELFVYLTGVSLYTGSELDFYGEAVSVLLVVFLVALSAGLWWLLWKIVRDLVAPLEEVTADVTPLPEISPRALAAWAFACALVIIPIGAALGPAWGQIQAVVLAGPATPTPTATPTATPTPSPPTPTAPPPALTPTPSAGVATTPTPSPPITPTPTADLAATPPPIAAVPGGWIAFASDRDGNTEIYKMRADGSQVTRLTDNPAVDWQSSWAPDGKWILYTSDRDGMLEIYVMRANGSQVTNLTNDPAWDWQPCWSPDGNWIAFESDRDGNAEIYKMRADGSQVTRLTDNPAPDWQPSWSPDGNWIAFNRIRDGNEEIYVMRADGSQVTRLTDNPARDGFPSWSPDGNWIAFESNRDGNAEIYKMRADGSQVTRLTNNPARDGFPSWSPDGNWIAFESNRDGNPEIYVMRADGSQVTRLTDNPAEDGEPSWGPSEGLE